MTVVSYGDNRHFCKNFLESFLSLFNLFEKKRYAIIKILDNLF